MLIARHILVLLAMVGMLAPGASGAVLCIERGGEIAIELTHEAPGCAPLCTPPTEGEPTPVSDECVDLTLVERVSQSGRNQLAGPDIAFLPRLSSSWAPVGPIAARRFTEKCQGAPPSRLSVSTTILRI